MGQPQRQLLTLPPTVFFTIFQSHFERASPITRVKCLDSKWMTAHQTSGRPNREARPDDLDMIEILSLQTGQIEA